MFCVAGFVHSMERMKTSGMCWWVENIDLFNIASVSEMIGVNESVFLILTFIESKIIWKKTAFLSDLPYVTFFVLVTEVWTGH